MKAKKLRRKARNALRKTLSRFLLPMGIDAVRVDHPYVPVARTRKRESLERLRACGLRISTVFDVGVHSGGTPALYEAFPEAHHVLIEPVREFAPSIEAIRKTIARSEVIWAAASNRPGTAQLSLRQGLTHATIGDVDEVFFQTDQKREVPVVTLDEVCESRSLHEPFLIKVDVDGRDLEVLEGAEEALRSTACVILESTLADLPERSQFVCHRGFFLWDVVDLSYKGGCLFQVDLVFLRQEYQKNEAFVPWLKPEILLSAMGQLPR